MPWPNPHHLRSARIPRGSRGVNCQQPNQPFASGFVGREEPISYWCVNSADRKSICKGGRANRRYLQAASVLSFRLRDSVEFLRFYDKYQFGKSDRDIRS